MTRMERIRDRVRDLTGKSDWSRMVEVSRAYRKICLVTKFNWLQAASQDLLSFTTGRSVYPLDMTRMRRLERIWVLNTEDEQNWQLLEEVPPQLFEQKVTENRDLNGDDETDTPLCYKITGGPVATVTVTPTPDMAYTVRVDYLEHQRDMTWEDDPKLPEVYDDTIAELAAGYVLEFSKDEHERALGAKYEARAMSEFEDIVKDSHPNRTIDIDRHEQAWLK